MITVGEWFGRKWTPGDLTRRAILSAAFSVYYARFLLIVFRFLRRGVSWSEVVTVASWLLIIQVTLVALGGTERAVRHSMSTRRRRANSFRSFIEAGT
jgi:hypothetical protein